MRIKSGTLTAKYGDMEETREWLAKEFPKTDAEMSIPGLESLFREDLEEAGITKKPVVREAQPRFSDLIRDL